MLNVPGLWRKGGYVLNVSDPLHVPNVPEFASARSELFFSPAPHPRPTGAGGAREPQGGGAGALESRGYGALRVARVPPQKISKNSYQK